MLSRAVEPHTVEELVGIIRRKLDLLPGYTTQRWHDAEFNKTTRELVFMGDLPDGGTLKVHVPDADKRPMPYTVTTTTAQGVASTDTQTVNPA